MEGSPFVLLQVKVSEDFESVSQSARRFPRILKAFRGAHGGFRGFGKHFAERAEVSEDFESVSRSARRFPRILKAFRGARGGFRGF